jgi:serine/threonine-protein kinase HipA
MRRARVDVMGQRAGVLEEQTPGRYVFRYAEAYSGPPVSLALPVAQREFVFAVFPPFFEGLLPEGAMLEGLLRQCKIDRADLFGQLLAVGGDTVGAVTVTGEDPA